MCEWDRDYFIPRQSAIAADLDRLLQGIDTAEVVSVHEALCDDDVCRRSEGGEPLYSDTDHVTALGATLMIEYAVQTTRSSVPPWEYQADSQAVASCHPA